MELPTRDEIKEGSHVLIETKTDQGSGKLTSGAVKDILTSAQSHPYGIKVRLDDGHVGRVKKIEARVSPNISGESGAKFQDVNMIHIPKHEDEHNEFKEFYQFDKLIANQDNIPEDKRDAVIKAKKAEVRERFATAVCSFANKDGGFVYIGIKSDGSIAGLETDKKLEEFKNYEDDFARHINLKLGELLDNQVFMLKNIQIRFRKIKQKTICIVQVLPASEPIFLNSKRGEEFYVRGAAPGSVRLEGKNRANYIKEHFYK